MWTESSSRSEVVTFVAESLSRVAKISLPSPARFWPPFHRSNCKGSLRLRKQIVPGGGHRRRDCLQTMDSLPTVLLKPGKADRVVAGHPWIYHGSILRLTRPSADGDLVQVKDHRQRFLGVGFYNSRSKIHVRVLAPDRVEINEAFFEQRVRAAMDVRRKHMPEATSFRVVNA